MKNIHNLAEAAQHILPSFAAQQYAASIALLAVHKAGDILSRLEKNAPGRHNCAAAAQLSQYNHEREKAGIEPTTARSWQAFTFQVSEEQVELYIADCKEKELEITRRGCLKRFPLPDVDKTERQTQRLLRAKQLEAEIRLLLPNWDLNITAGEGEGFDFMFRGLTRERVFDVAHAIRGNVEQVREQVKRRLAAFDKQPKT